MIDNIWMVSSKYSKICKLYSVFFDKTIKDKILNETDYKSVIQKIKDKKYTKYNKNALIEEESYYVDSKKIEEEVYLAGFRKILSEIYQGQKDVIKLKDKNKVLSDKEVPRILIYEYIDEISDNEYFLFTSIDTRHIVKSKTIIDIDRFLNKSKERYVSKNTTHDENYIYDITQGIIVPKKIIAIYDKSNSILYVDSVLEFEGMLFIHEQQKERAKNILSDFEKGINLIGKEHYAVKGIDKSFEEQVLSKFRSSARLAKYDLNEQKHSIANIKKAVNRLSKEDRVLFDDKNKIIIVDSNVVKTFVAIIHNGIVERLISGEIDLIG
ncbi:MAG: hypothetical protein VB128_12085 [Sedimentibacter saalensis]|uniref:hypothetical protein n=1 Tax=Sedimentibacter saalensis TaxID=130788 RepID=UPI002B2128E6|nr:hypothetical protein [Sedimentibacter saalensis]MEA5095684.1 hypothetical protein [Sedimentibacter saalensis]